MNKHETSWGGGHIGHVWARFSSWCFGSDSPPPPLHITGGWGGGASIPQVLSCLSACTRAAGFFFFFLHTERQRDWFDPSSAFHFVETHETKKRMRFPYESDYVRAPNQAVEPRNSVLCNWIREQPSKSFSCRFNCLEASLLSRKAGTNRTNKQIGNVSAQAETFNVPRSLN